ncbi:MAG: hypothetical protein AAGB31_15990 [Bdellovibrio sp.]
MSCSAKIDPGDAYLLIHSCVGADKAIGLYSRMTEYGYSADVLILDEVVSRPASGKAATSDSGIQ